jgi:molecular chaperone GrpE
MDELEVQLPENAAADQETVIEPAAEPSTSLLDEIAQLRAALEASEAQSAQNLVGWQRAQATYENYRKRTEAERVEWTANANIILLARLLPVLDDFERAFTNLPETLRDEPWANGVRLIEQKLRHVLTLEGVEPIVIQPGDLFDPFFHQAVLQQVLPGYEEGQIIAEVQRGYRLGQRIVRPAQVVVAKGLEEATPVEAAPAAAAPAEKE